MIEVKAVTNDGKVAVDSHMDGTGADLLIESVGLMRGLIDHFGKCNLAMEFVLMATSAMAEYAEGVMGDSEKSEDGEELA